MLEIIVELLLICVDFEYYICQEFKVIVDFWLFDVESKIIELKRMCELLKWFSDVCCGSMYVMIYCLILEVLE